MSRFSQISEVSVRRLSPDGSQSRKAVHVRPTNNPYGTTYATFLLHCLRLLWSLPSKNWSQQNHQTLRRGLYLFRYPSCASRTRNGLFNNGISSNATPILRNPWATDPDDK